jgi:hypothetical protein
MANGWGTSQALTGMFLDAVLNGGTLSFSNNWVGLYVNGSPGVDGKSNLAAETNRLQITPTVTGISSALSGSGPSWTITATAGELLSGIGIFSDSESNPDAVFLFSLPVPNVQVAFGDVVTLNSLLLAAAAASLAS